MSCANIRRELPGYLDGALHGDADSNEHARLREHLENCDECRAELERYHRLSVVMSRVERAAPPEGLDVRIRVAVAKARAARGWAGRVADRAQLILHNILQPVALPATGGVLAAVMVLVMYHVIGVGVPLGAVPNDVPTNLLQPARVESLAPFPVTAAAESDEGGMSGPHALLVEATVNAQGQVVNYQILSGPRDLAVRRQLDQVLLFSRFRPQMSFGRPTPGGHVVLSFSEIRVKG